MSYVSADDYDPIRADAVVVGDELRLAAKRAPVLAVTDDDEQIVLSVQIDDYETDLVFAPYTEVWKRVRKR